MPKYPAKDQQVFAGSLTPSGNVAVVGSTITGTPAYSSDLTVLQSLAAFLNGFSAQVVNGTASPVLQEFNAILRIITQQLAFLLERGSSEWTATKTYFVGALSQNGAGVFYISLTDNNTNNALTDTNSWKPFVDTLRGPSLLKAWAVFDGATGALVDAFNIASVNVDSAGTYTLTFATAMANNKYGFSGACGTVNGGSGVPGDDNTVCGGNVRTTTQFNIRCWDSKNSVTESPDRVMVQVFGSDTP